VPLVPLVAHRKEFGDKAPITEASLDIQVSTPEDLDLEDLRDFAAPLGGRYPTKRLQSQFESQIRVETGQAAPSVVTQHAVRGFSFFSPNQDRVVQARRDGYTFSKLHPYDTWDELRREAQEIWTLYRAAARPTSVHRLAARYINRIPLPPEPIQLQDWFNLHPEIPEQLGPMEEFLIRSVVRHPANPDYRAIMTLATDPPDPTGLPAVMLDIDVFTIVEVDPANDRIWAILEDLRVFKNDVFFGTITPRTEAFLA
jgi:uncharacterized protein (TIGR04255 family)